MASMFKDIGNHELNSRPPYFEQGFDGVVEVVKTFTLRTRRQGDAFIVNFKVLESNSGARPGSLRSYFCGCNEDMFFDKVCVWAAATLGIDPNDKETIDDTLLCKADENDPDSPAVLQRMLDDATDSPRKNVFTGLRLHVSCVEAHETKNNKIIYPPRFSPVESADSAPDSEIPY